MNAMKALLALAMAGLVGCSTWEGMSRTEKDTVIGAGVGGLAGNAVSGGSTLGTLGGAAVGGVIGHELGQRDRR